MRALPIALGLVAASLVVPADALACSCAAGMSYALPSWGATDVPTNPKIHLGFTYMAAPLNWTLVDASGERYPLNVESKISGITEEITLTLVNRALLPGGTAFVVIADGEQVLDFTTADRPDNTAPTLAGISSFEGGFDDGCTLQAGDVVCDTCGPSTLMYARYDSPRDDQTQATKLLYRVYVAVNGTEPAEGSYSYVSPGWPVGSSLCTTTYEGLKVGDVVTIRAAVIDAAGNESPLTAPISATVADDPDAGVGCSGANGTASSSAAPTSEAPVEGLMLFGLAGLLGLGLRRRL